MSKQRITDWYEHFGGQVYVSFSAGKDSSVLLHLVRSIYPEVPAVLSNTGLEFPQVVQFAKTVPNVIWIKPDMTFRRVIEKHGYPVIGKEQSEWIHRARCGNPDVHRKNVLGIMPDGSKTRFHISRKWRYLLEAPFLIGAGCCLEMKKKPLGRYANESGRVPFVGMMDCESMLRTQKWLQYGCNAYDNKKTVSTPLSFWLDTDIWDYIHAFKLPYCSIYDMGYSGTGCVFCMYGVHLEKQPNRFQMLQKTHPKLWRYCMRDWDAGGLGFGLLVDTEWATRKNNRFTRLIKNAGFAFNDTCIENIEYHADRNLDKAQIARFSTCNHIQEYHNIIILGATGSGKTYLSNAFGMTASRNFYTVKYARLPDLLGELAIARGEGAYRKIIKQYKQVKFLILDEWLLFPLKESEARDLLEIVEARHKKASTIFCSQFEVGGWYPKIGEPTSADAICDRIVHDSYTIIIGGTDSMRKRKV